MTTTSPLRHFVVLAAGANLRSHRPRHRSPAFRHRQGHRFQSRRRAHRRHRPRRRASRLPSHQCAPIRTTAPPTATQTAAPRTRRTPAGAPSASFEPWLSCWSFTRSHSQEKVASATRKPAELHRSVPKTAISNFLQPGVAASMRRAFARSKCVARAAAATPSIHLGVRQTHQTWHRGTRRLRVRRCRLATSSSRAAKTSRRWWHRQRWPTTRSCR